MITEALINKYIAKVKQDVIDELGKRFTEVTDDHEERIAELEGTANDKPPIEEKDGEENDGFF